MSVSAPVQAGCTADIFRRDGKSFPGPRADYTLFGPPPQAGPGGEGFIQLGHWRLGNVDGGHFSICHRLGKTVSEAASMLTVL
jgi:hypothetical protein